MKVLYIENRHDDYDRISRVLCSLADRMGFEYVYDEQELFGFVPHADGAAVYTDEEQLERTINIISNHWEQVDIFVVDIALTRWDMVLPPVSIAAFSKFLSSGDEAAKAEKRALLESGKKVILFVTTKVNYIDKYTNQPCLDYVYEITYKHSYDEDFEKEHCSLRHNSCARWDDDSIDSCTYGDCFENKLLYIVENVRAANGG